MTEFTSCFEFTHKGVALFRRVLYGEEQDKSIDLTDDRLVLPVDGTNNLGIGECATAKKLAQRIVVAIGRDRVRSLLAKNGLWCWLTFVFREQLFRVTKGTRVRGEVHRWFPSDPNDWRKAQRHLVRMPVLLLAEFGDDADHLLCSSPAVLPEVREQLTSQQDMLEPSFQRLARRLYYDEKNGKLKKGVSGKGAGSARRLAQVKRQLDVTWDLSELDVEDVMKMLPGEFSRFARG